MLLGTREEQPLSTSDSAGSANEHVWRPSQFVWVLEEKSSLRKLLGIDRFGSSGHGSERLSTREFPKQH